MTLRSEVDIDFNEFNFTVQFEIFGELVQVYSPFKSLIDDVKDFFSINDCQDIIGTPREEIYINLKHSQRYLFRSHPDNYKLENVYYKDSTGKIIPWNFNTPPIPPFETKTFKDRLIAFHAGGVSFNDNAFIFLGEKGAGKTTTVTTLVNEHHYHALTDETIIIFRNTKTVTPFPRIVLPRFVDNNQITKGKERADNHFKYVSTSNKQIKGIFILKPSTQNKITKLTSISTCSYLLENFQYAGTSLRDAIATIVKLSSVGSYLIEYIDNDFNSLNNSISHIQKIIDKN